MVNKTNTTSGMPTNSSQWLRQIIPTNSSPLRGHQLSEVQQLLLFFTCPFRLLDGWVKPLVPSIVWEEVTRQPHIVGSECFALAWCQHRSAGPYRALHCFEDLRFINEAMRAHWFFPYFITAALRTSSSVFFHTPPLICTHYQKFHGQCVLPFEG